MVIYQPYTSVDEAEFVVVPSDEVPKDAKYGAITDYVKRLFNERSQRTGDWTAEDLDIHFFKTKEEMQRFLADMHEMGDYDKGLRIRRSGKIARLDEVL